MKIYGVIIYCSLFFICWPVYGVGYIEVREAWDSASKEHQFKLGAGYHFRNGAGLLYQTTYNTGRNLDQLEHSFDEIEGWYPLWKMTDALTLYAGGLINSTSSGSTIAPYIQFGYLVSPDFAVAFKYRYNHMNYQTRNLTGIMDYNDSHQFIVVANYKINEVLNYEFEPDLYINSGEYHRKNGKGHSWELNHKVTWKMSNTWRPFIQLSWLDRDAGNHAERYRIRLGIRYYL